MKVKINKGVAKGYIDAPPSKSMAHRMLICAGLSTGTCLVHGISESEDILATMDCLEILGAKFQKQGSTVKVQGCDFNNVEANKVLECRESGSTLRFFVPICLLAGKELHLTGSKRLLERPLDVYREICDEKGINFIHDEKGVSVCGPLKAGTYKMAGNVSSQFISGLLFALPLLDEDSSLEIIPPIESRPYIDMTISALNTFGVKVYWEGDNTLIIPGRQTYYADEVTVEGDYSNAAFLEALNIFGGEVEVGNLTADSLQGDKVYGDMFRELQRGCAELDISNCPDLGPILFAVSAAMKGGKFTGTERLKIKESDRATVMAEELKKFGVNVIVGDDFVTVEPSEFTAPVEELYGHNDHRIVMSMAVLATITGGTISGAQAVNKSFPDFFEKITSLGIEVNILED